MMLTSLYYKNLSRERRSYIAPGAAVRHKCISASPARQYAERPSKLESRSWESSKVHIICTLGARHSSDSRVYLVSNQVYGVQGV
jgi:hypothetical protein